MFLIIFCSITLVLNIANASEQKVEDKLNGRDELEAQFVRKNGRIISVWRPEFHNEKENSKHSWYKDAITNPYSFFARDLNESLADFERVAKDFNSCVAKTKWPESNECLKIVDICFGDHDRRNSCLVDPGAHFKLNPLCQGTTFKSCMLRFEKEFNLYTQCFNLKRHIHFAFYPFGPNAEREDFVGIRVDATIDEDDKYYWMSCDFSLYKGKLSIIDIGQGLAWDSLPERPFPRTNFKSKSGFN